MILRSAAKVDIDDNDGNKDDPSECDSLEETQKECEFIHEWGWVIKWNRLAYTAIVILLKTEKETYLLLFRE